MSESDLPECARLSAPQAALEEALKASAKASEDQQMKEALARSQNESEMKRKRSESSEDNQPAKLEILPTDKFTEENVQTLMKYGFERAKCIEELRRNNGDMTQATAALFAKSLKF